MEKRGSMMVVAVVVIALIIAIGIGYYFGSSNAEKNETSAVPEQAIPTGESGGEEVPAVTPPEVSAPVAKNWAVDIKNYTFVPSELTINSGDSVTWTNRDRYAHTPIADDVVFVSRPLNTEGENFTFTFEKAGTHNYHCRIHPTETGVIMVQ